MSIIRSEVKRRFAAAKLNRAKQDPITGGVWLGGLVDDETLESVARRAWLAQEYFFEFGPPGAPPLPLNDLDMESVAKTGDLGIAVALFAASLEANDWDFKKHPGFEEYVRGLLSLTNVVSPMGRFEDEEALLLRFGAHPLQGLWATGIWTPPVKPSVH